MARARDSPYLTGWPQRTISTAIICCMPHEPTCCAALGQMTKRQRVICGRSRWSPMIASGDISSGGLAKFSPQRDPASLILVIFINQLPDVLLGVVYRFG